MDAASDIGADAAARERPRAGTAGAPQLLPTECGVAAGGVLRLFVYGTLLPGDVRFHLLQPFVVDHGWPDSIRGRLFDTGADYPAVILTSRLQFPVGDDRDDRDGEPTVVGRTFTLLESSAERALEVLDDVEGVVDGDYRRVLVATERGVRSWVYEYGGGLELTPITSGDWLAHRPLERAHPLPPQRTDGRGPATR